MPRIRVLLEKIRRVPQLVRKFTPFHGTVCIMTVFTKSPPLEILVLGCYATQSRSYPPFGATYWSHIQGSSPFVLCSVVVVKDVSGEPISRIFSGHTDVFGPISRFRLKNGPIGCPDTSVITNLHPRRAKIPCTPRRKPEIKPITHFLLSSTR